MSNKKQFNWKRFIILSALGGLSYFALIFFTDNMHIHYSFMQTYMKGSNTSNIYDHEVFPSRTITKGALQPWNVSSLYNTKQLPEKYVADFADMNSVAYIIIKNDSIVYEQYWDEINATSKTNSFSMAKSIVSMLIGIAIDEGKIGSVDQLVGDFLPTFKDGKKANITIKHMLTMSSGMGYEESYKSPFSYTAESYYGRHLEKLTLEYDAVEEPGKTYNYLSGNTQILGMILEKSYGKNISELTSEKLWKPMGASQDALWSLDVEDGMEKGFCCYHSNARDFARFGKLFLDSGKFNGIQLISKKYVQESITPADLIYPAKDEHTKYGYQWWLMPNYKGHNIFMMKGHLGQHVICLPKENMIIVRLGNKSEHIIPGRHSPETYRYIDVALEMYGNN